MKKVSVIIPAYNCKNYLGRAVESCINQKYKNIEIIIVDDGSSDGTSQLCDEFSEKDDRIKIIHQENKGVSSARNNGINVSTGEYITFLDSDDYFDEGMIDDLISSNKTNNELIGVMYKKIQNKNEIIKKYNNKYETSEYIKNIFYGKTHGSCWKYLFKTKEIKENNIYFDTNAKYMEDTLFLIHYLEKTQTTTIRFVDNGNYYNYFDNDNSVTHKRNSLNSINSYYYSLNEIDKFTDFKYTNEINDAKIILLEKELRLDLDKKKIKETLKYAKSDINPLKMKNNSIKYIIFLILIKKDLYLALRVYYYIRGIVKKIKNHI